MPRPSPFVATTAWVLAAAVGVALAAPAGCSPRTEAEAPMVAVSVSPAPDTLATPEPAPEETAPSGRAAPVAERSAIPDGFVRLREFAPQIAQEVRYATAYNFVGAPIDGYEAPECILTTEAARALRQVAEDLARDGFGLKVYDCYRPQTAVDHFVRWARSDDEAMKTAFYPEEPKGSLFRRGYIARRSGHSRGSTVDLTLVRQPVADAIVPASDYPDPAAGASLPRCDRPVSTSADPASGDDGRLFERDLDMGTAYDCLSPVAATASTAVSREARANRQRLKAAMERRGFRNYSKEWWHFTLRGEPHPQTFFDFPVN